MFAMMGGLSEWTTPLKHRGLAKLGNALDGGSGFARSAPGRRWRGRRGLRRNIDKATLH